ncbi:xanthine dehydrogenase family protein (plasmid) [Diaphorobacter sp. HDW4B]|uniref:xanthine dehydrogenase family protein molybdopterin-binding subunit n=1 Tax=Diaphorobacter sp. HDW4B TaxID=2714925 RepID=UPI001407680E|nr:xanthine dehydrogenase family protein molybdopterin-binding subunit [Diaphorobacter sp. HDW4B]QIL74231.1 xanthine dehydrogenase family protein [Diaphorobacter sp. HDW4B]
MNHDEAVIGMNLPRRDAADKLRGRTRYTVDRSYPGMAHGALLRSEVQSGLIVHLDCSKARAMPGVRAIVTAQDAPGRHGIGVADEVLFASERVRFVGEPIAAVAADTLEQARAAAAAIELTIQPLPAVTTMEDALAPGAPLVHPDWESHEILFQGGKRGGNVAWEATVVRGDVDAAFARDDVTIVDSHFRVPRQNHLSFEPRAVIAQYEDGRFHIETSTQVPWTVRTATARYLQVSPAQIRVTVPPVGGAFGLKFDCAIEPYAALLARASGRPVKLVNSRQEEMQTCLCRENAEIRIRSAITRDGQIAAREAVVLMDGGAFGGEQIFLTTMTAHTLGGNYRLQNVRLVSRVIYTNTPPNGAFRACNGVYNTFALERHTDEICAVIDMDPLEFRRRNVLGHKDIGATGQVFEGDVLAPMLGKMEQLKASKPSCESKAGHRRYGRATVVGTWFVFVGPSSATVNLNLDGSVTLVTSGVEIGSGSMMQSIPQIVADTLGLRPQDVIVRTADTDGAGYDLGIGGGRQTVALGAASRMASLEVKDKVLRIASQMLEASAEDLVLREGRVEILGARGSGVTLTQIVERAHAVMGPIAGTGAFTKPGVAAMPGCAAGHFIEAIDIPVFAVHDCEVAVDTDTGHIEVLSYAVVQDVGRALNPRAIHGQIQGGVVQGLGYALHEEITLGDQGQVLQTGLESFRVPLAQDVVPVDIVLHEGAPSIGPLGIKGAGEVPILNVGAAVACAVAHATGCRVQELPLTAPRTLTMLLGLNEPLRFPHIADQWRQNLLGNE